MEGQLTSRLGRLLRDLHQIPPGQQDLLQEAIYGALDMLSEQWGVKL